MAHFKVIRFTTLILSFVAINAWVGARALSFFQRDFNETPQIDLERIHPDVVRAVSMGQWPAWVDYMWVETLLDPATHRVGKKDRSGIFYNLDVLTELDPYYYDAYWGGGNLLSVIRDDGWGARDILVKGNRFRKEGLPKAPARLKEVFWQNDWAVPLVLGYVYLFDLDDLPKAQEVLEESAQLPGSPPYLQSLTARLRKPGGPFEIGINLLKFMQSTQRDEEIKKKLRRREVSLEVSYHLFLINEDFKVWLQKKKNPQISEEKVQTFLRQRGMSKDPWGGKYLFKDARIESETPRERVFGLR